MVERLVDVEKVEGSIPSARTTIMKKEKTASLSKDTNATRILESSKLVFRSPQNAFESGDHITYEWLEDSVIRGMASVEFGKNEIGKDTATIKLIDPKTKEKKTIYFTADENEVSRLKDISEGKGIMLDVQDETLKDKTGN